MQIKNWIIKKLGGITKQQLREFKIYCSDYAQENLKAKDESFSPDAYYYYPYGGDKITVLRSKITLIGGEYKSVTIAPWCVDVVATGIRMKGEIKTYTYNQNPNHWR